MASGCVFHGENSLFLLRDILIDKAQEAFPAPERAGRVGGDDLSLPQVGTQDVRLMLDARACAPVEPEQPGLDLGLVHHVGVDAGHKAGAVRQLEQPFVTDLERRLLLVGDEVGQSLRRVRLKVELCRRHADAQEAFRLFLAFLRRLPGHDKGYLRLLRLEQLQYAGQIPCDFLLRHQSSSCLYAHAGRSSSTMGLSV